MEKYRERIITFFQRFYTPGYVKFCLDFIPIYIFDLIHRTNFGGRIFQSELNISVDRANDYSATPNEIKKTLRKLNVSYCDAIADLGCGKGMGLYYMAQFPFYKIGGVELSERLIEDCKKNLGKLYPNDKRFVLDCCDAAEWDKYCDFNIFYIYNSFPRNVMRDVLSQIDKSIDIKPRRVIILYLYPEHADIINRTKRWVLISGGDRKLLRGGMHIYMNVL